MRRQSKVSESVEYYTTLRSQRAAERADVALVVCDATDGITAQDLRIAELAMKAGCATASCSTSGISRPETFDLDYERGRIARKLRLRPRLLTASALTAATSAACSTRRWRSATGCLTDPDARAQPLPRRGASRPASRRPSRATG